MGRVERRNGTKILLRRLRSCNLFKTARRKYILIIYSEARQFLDCGGVRFCVSLRTHPTSLSSRSVCQSIPWNRGGDLGVTRGGLAFSFCQPPLPPASSTLPTLPVVSCFTVTFLAWDLNYAPVERNLEWNWFSGSHGSSSCLSIAAAPRRSSNFNTA